MDAVVREMKESGSPVEAACAILDPLSIAASKLSHSDRDIAIFMLSQSRHGPESPHNYITSAYLLIDHSLP